MKGLVFLESTLYAFGSQSPNLYYDPCDRNDWLTHLSSSGKVGDTEPVTGCHQCEDVLGEMRFEPSTRTHFSSLFYIVLFRKESGDLIPIVLMVQHKMFT